VFRWLSTILAVLFMANLPAVVYVEANEPAGQESVMPLARAHAHNDYWHSRPLYDALDHGFTSVEADVWLKEGKLLVGHSEDELGSGRTLQSLYLNPLKETVQKNGGTVYPGYPHEFILWVDIKSDGESTYLAVHKVLSQYKDMLTQFNLKGVKAGAVTVIISGNRPRALMENQPVRYAGYDGRLSDLGSDTSPQFMPVISDNWTKYFTWQGKGPMPEEERAKLHAIVSTAHAHGQKVRFWATPDEPSPERDALWKELMKADVDLINTDDLAGLQSFLQKYDPHPSEPSVTWQTADK
jgi:hypothetical protein